jgi:hypothetical protein
MRRAAVEATATASRWQDVYTAQVVWTDVRVALAMQQACFGARVQIDRSASSRLM